MELIVKISSSDYLDLMYKKDLIIEGYAGLPIDIVCSVGPAVIDGVTDKILEPSFFIVEIYTFDSMEEMRHFKLDRSHN